MDLQQLTNRVRAATDKTEVLTMSGTLDSGLILVGAVLGVAGYPVLATALIIGAVADMLVCVYRLTR